MSLHISLKIACGGKGKWQICKFSYFSSGGLRRRDSYTCFSRFILTHVMLIFKINCSNFKIWLVYTGFFGMLSCEPVQCQASRAHARYFSTSGFVFLTLPRPLVISLWKCQTTWIQMRSRVTWRLIRIQVVWIYNDTRGKAVNGLNLTTKVECLKMFNFSGYSILFYFQKTLVYKLSISSRHVFPPFLFR